MTRRVPQQGIRNFALRVRPQTVLHSHRSYDLVGELPAAIDLIYTTPGRTMGGCLRTVGVGRESETPICLPQNAATRIFVSYANGCIEHQQASKRFSQRPPSSLYEIWNILVTKIVADKKDYPKGLNSIPE
jgi:hypothetical protein